MKKKLTEMDREELLAYRKKAEKRQLRYKQGSKNWLKCQIRINRSKMYIRTLSN